MGAFSTISAGATMQNLAFVNELLTAYSEHRQVLGQSAVAPLVTANTIQSSDFWAAMQGWVESNLTSFVDHTATIAGETAVPMWTVANFKTQSGLTGSGTGNGMWRRLTGDSWANWTDYASAIFTYGGCQPSDVKGPWLIQDLETALLNLLWTTSSSGDSATGAGYIKDLTTDGTLEEHCADWAAEEWEQEQGAIYQCAGFTGTGSHRSFRQYNQPQATVFTGLASNYYCYALAGPPTFGTFYDFDELGMENGKLFLVDISDGAASDSPRIAQNSELIYDPDICPAGMAGMTTDLQGAILSLASGARWVWQWEFTYDS